MPTAAAKESCKSFINLNCTGADKGLFLKLDHERCFYPLPSIQKYYEDKQKISEIEVKEIISRHKAGEHLGICSVCSAHPLVIESALRLISIQTVKC